MRTVVSEPYFQCGLWVLPWDLWPILLEECPGSRACSQEVAREERFRSCSRCWGSPRTHESQTAQDSRNDLREKSVIRIQVGRETGERGKKIEV